MGTFAHPRYRSSSFHATRQHDSSAASYWGRRLAIVILLVFAAGIVVGFQRALTALTLIGFAAAIVGLRRPALGLLGIGMLCTLDAIMGPLLLSGGLLRWNTLNYWLLVAAALSLTFLLRLSDIHTRLLQLFVLLLGLQLAISADPVLGTQTVVAVAVLFGILGYFARACQDDQNWYWLGLVDGLLGAAGGLVFYLQKNQLPYVNSNNWGFFPLTAIFSICLALPFAHKQPRGQLYLMLLAIVNVAWVFLSASRGNLLLAGGCLLFLVLMMRGLSSKLVFVISALLIGLIVSTQFADLEEHTLSRLDLLVDPAYTERQRTSGRGDLVRGGWLIFSDHPFGVGTGGYATTWAGIDYDENLSGFRRGQKFPAHAGWIKTLAENGIVGITLLVSYVSSFMIVGMRKHDRDLRLLGLLMTLIFSLAFISIEFQWGKGIWFMAAGLTTLLHKQDILFHLNGSTNRVRIRNIIRPRRVVP